MLWLLLLHWSQQTSWVLLEVGSLYYPTGPFTNLELQNQEISEIFFVVQECRATHSEATKLLIKDRSGRMFCFGRSKPRRYWKNMQLAIRRSVMRQCLLCCILLQHCEIVVVAYTKHPGDLCLSTCNCLIELDKKRCGYFCTNTFLLMPVPDTDQELMEQKKTQF